MCIRDRDNVDYRVALILKKKEFPDLYKDIKLQNAIAKQSLNNLKGGKND